MGKKIRLNTISLGSEPDQPDISVVAEFISTFLGFEADIVTCMLASSLKAQKEAGIVSPCAGGLFTSSRFDTAITCSKDECYSDPAAFVSDAEIMVQILKRVKSALPAPDMIQSAPDSSDEDQYADFCDLYLSILRSMRDVNISGHILHTRDPSPIFLELLGSAKTLFVNPEGNQKSQELLLEYQETLVLHTDRIRMLSDLIDQYDVRRIIIQDPDTEGIKEALRHMDPEKVSVCGYGSGSEGEYWKKVFDSAEVLINIE